MSQRIVENVKVAIPALSVFITIRSASKKDRLFIEIISMDLGIKIRGFLVFWSNEYLTIRMFQTYIGHPAEQN